MSNLEHLIENGLIYMQKKKNYNNWIEIMKEDINWKGNENLTIDNLWTICQYIIYTYLPMEIEENVNNSKKYENAT